MMHMTNDQYGAWQPHILTHLVENVTAIHLVLILTPMPVIKFCRTGTFLTILIKKNPHKLLNYNHFKLFVFLGGQIFTYK